MGKQLQIRIYPDGRVEGETFNIKGKACEKYLEVMARLAQAQIVDSDYTPEFYEAESQAQESATLQQEV